MGWGKIVILCSYVLEYWNWSSQWKITKSRYTRTQVQSNTHIKKHLLSVKNYAICTAYQIHFSRFCSCIVYKSTCMRQLHHLRHVCVSYSGTVNNHTTSIPYLSPTINALAHPSKQGPMSKHTSQTDWTLRVKHARAQYGSLKKLVVKDSTNCLVGGMCSN